jgi:hypothetical protein
MASDKMRFGITVWGEECSVNCITQLRLEYVLPRKRVGNAAATMSGHWQERPVSETDGEVCDVIDRNVISNSTE